MSQETTMPHSRESEMMVLGAMLTSNNALNVSADSLSSTDFYFTEHKTIFDGLKTLHVHNKPADIHLLAEELKKQGSLEAIGNVSYLVTLAQYVGTSAYIEEYIGVLREKTTLRRILQIAQLVQAKALSEPDDVEQALNEAKQLFSGIELFERGGQKFSLRFIGEISSEYFKTKPKEKPRLLHFVDQSGRKIPFLHRGVVGMLVAEGGVGKTHLLALLALSVSTGVPWVGKFMVEQPGAVCLILGENDSDDIHRLLSKVRTHFVKMLEENSSKKDYEKFMLHFQEPLDQVLINLCAQSVHGLDAGFIDAKGRKTAFYQKLLIELKAKEPPDGWQLIILDPASRFAGPETEKDNAIATAFIASLEHMSNELIGRPTILVAHHKSKAAQQKEGGGQSDARGASGLTDGARWQANINKDQNDKCVFWLEITKTNFTPPFCKIKLKKDQDGVPVFDGFDLGEEELVSGTARSILKKKPKNGN